MGRLASSFRRRLLPLRDHPFDPEHETLGGVPQSLYRGTSVQQLDAVVDRELALRELAATARRFGVRNLAISAVTGAGLDRREVIQRRVDRGRRRHERLTGVAIYAHWTTDAAEWDT